MPLVRVLSKLGYCSRMQAVELVKAGRVAVSGRVIRDPGSLTAFTVAITVDGAPVTAASLRYVLLNKPRGSVTTRSDELERDTVYDSLPGLAEWLAPVGRLDRDSEGLLLLTNDTRLAAWLTDPANEVPRVYVVTVRPGITGKDLATISGGVRIGEGEVSTPLSARLLEGDHATSTLELTLTEGRNREVRRLFRAHARRVIRLKRIAFGPFELGDLAPGAWRELTPAQAAAAYHAGRGRG